MDSVLVSPHPLPAPSSRARVWTGRVLTGLIATFLAIDSIGKLIPLDAYVEGTQKVGYAVETLRPLGLVLLLSTVLHVIPRTQLVGAALLTAYLGGATATHVRMGTPFWFPVGMGVLVWIAYYLRSSQLRALFINTTAH